jgi:RNA polymerase sigma-70 factor (ECF subfamily)
MDSIEKTWLTTEEPLRSFVYRKVRDKALADDIVQDVFLKVYSQIDTVRDNEKITGWIYQITRNAIMDHFRKRAKPISFDMNDWETDEPNYNECVALCLKDMLQRIPAKYREAIELTEFENLSQMQLAARLNISYSGAKSRVQRAREMMRTRMLERYKIKLDAYGNAVVCEDRTSCCA